MINPVPISEILTEEFLIPMGISAQQLSEKSGFTEEQVSALCSDRLAIDADIADGLAVALGNSSMFWLNMQRYIDECKTTQKGNNMVDFPIKNGTLRINPQHVQALWQGNNTSTTTIVVGSEALTYEVAMPIDEVEKKLKAETSDLGLISNQLLQLTTAMRPKV